MTPATTPQSPILPLPIVWWILWFSMTNGVIVLGMFLGSGATPAAGAIGFIALGPLVVSALIRFLLLPRFTTPAKAFPVFVVGLATAEACGILGLFLGAKNADAFVGLSLVMLLLYLPLFILRRFNSTRSSPFRQN